MRGKHAGQQNGGCQTEVEQKVAGQCSQDHGNNKSKTAKGKAFVAVFLKVVQINLHTSQKHNIEQTYSSKQHNAGITGKQVESMRAYQCTRYN
jgi:hypothetical protein